MYDLYASSRNDQWRFVLGKAGRRPLFVIGLNPSKATQEKGDVTVTKVERVARAQGFDGFVMLNLYPIRATDCRMLPLAVDAAAFEQNLTRIAVLVAAEPEPVVWVAWGGSIDRRVFFVDAIRALATRLPADASWQHFGPLTHAGHPRHPSRLAYSWSFAPFPLADYVARLNQ